ncbi:MAG: CTP synthase [Candidatus Ranarchaeia archaeon]
MPDDSSRRYIQNTSLAKQPRYIFITGGVASGIGKGVTAASISRLLQNHGFNVDYIKIDPYLNVDPGTLNPIEHGEVFITEEVWDFQPTDDMKLQIAELDQDFGHFERFTNQIAHPRNNITSGQVYLTVILQERFGRFLGKTIQIVPHLTDEIKRRIREIAVDDKDIIVIEVGGTAGDIESAPFLEAIRQFRLEEERHQTALIHVTILPFLQTVGQLKTKPTQHSVKALQSAGLQPDIIIGRAKTSLPIDVREKISKYCNVPRDAVFSNPDLDLILRLPDFLEKQGFFRIISRLLNLPEDRQNLDKINSWAEMIQRHNNAEKTLQVAVAGKYVSIEDSYISICKALNDGAVAHGFKTHIEWVDTENIEGGLFKLGQYDRFHGILLTPGFGKRGTEGMIQTANYARQKGIPLLGICFGAQLMTVAFARSMMGWTDANSTEVDPNTTYPVVDLLPEQQSVDLKGGTMRLGAHVIKLVENTRLSKAYGASEIKERFRHRYHIIPAFVHKMRDRGLIVSAYDPTGKIINAIEYAGHPFAVGVQFHPEFKSRPEAPSPVYSAFAKAMSHRFNKIEV